MLRYILVRIVLMFFFFRAPLPCLIFVRIRLCPDDLRFCANLARGCFPSKQDPDIPDISERAKLRNRVLMALRKFSKAAARLVHSLAEHAVVSVLQRY